MRNRPLLGSKLIALVCLAVVVSVSACSRSHDLTREQAQRLIEGNKPAISAARFQASGLVDTSNIAGSTWQPSQIKVTGVSMTSPTVASVTFSAEMKADGKDQRPFSGEATFRLFDDGWRLDSIVGQ